MERCSCDGLQVACRFRKRTQKLHRTHNTWRVTSRKARTDMNMAIIKQAEYLWLDGATPVHRLRSKSRIVVLPDMDPVIATFPGTTVR